MDNRPADHCLFVREPKIARQERNTSMSDGILIVYYSHSGNTRKIAELVQRKSGGELCEIQPVTAYPAAYDAVVDQAKKEIQAGFHPELKSAPGDVGSYDTVFVGTPNWWSTIAPPIATFLSGHDWSGKTVVPFCTHGGGGVGRVERDIAKLCAGATVKPGLVVSGSGGSRAEALVEEWLRKIGVAG